MLGSSTGIAFSPTVQLLSEVMRDLEDLRNRTRVIPIVDPYDIIRYAFPSGLDVSKTNAPAESVATWQANEQIALYELFHNWPTRPLLLREYTYEIARLHGALRVHASDAFDSYEVIGHIAEGSPGLKASDAHLIDRVERHFSLAFAVATGLVSVGAARMHDVVVNRCLTEDTVDDADLRVLCRSYTKPSEKFKSFWAEAEEAFECEFAGLDKLTRERKVRALHTDVRVIDKLLFLSSRMPPNTRLVYFSSARRTEALLALPSVVRAGREESVSLEHRSSQHMLNIVANKGAGHRTSEHLARTIAAVERTQRVLQYVQDIENADPAPQAAQSAKSLGDWVGESMDPDEWTNELARMQSKLEHTSASIMNVRLSADVSQNQAIVRGLKKLKLQEQEPVIRYLLSLFREAASQSGFKDRAVEKLQTLERLRLASVEQRVGTNDGKITVPLQTSPILIRLRSSRFISVYQNLYSYCTTPMSERPRTRHLFDKAYDELASAAVSETDIVGQAEREILVCLMCAALPGAHGDAVAFKRAAVAAKTFATYEQEFMYIAAWAARVAGEHDASDLYARLGISKWPDDPRFYHSLSLNEYARRDGRTETDNRSLSNAVKLGSTAARLYSAMPEWKEFVGVNLHNVAFFMSSEPDDRAFDIVAARDAIERLKRIVPEPNWFTEYHHSEALVEFREYQKKRADGLDQAELCRKLSWATRRLERAMDGHVKTIYNDLEGYLEKAITELGCEDVEGPLLDD